MKQINAPCGNDCNICPKKNEKNSEILIKYAKLWHKIGFSDRPLSIKQMQCKGCSPTKECRYDVASCIEDHKTQNCSSCSAFPCEKIGKMLIKTKEFDLKAREVCSDNEYEILSKAFFRKGKNLLKNK